MAIAVGTVKPHGIRFKENDMKDCVMVFGGPSICPEIILSGKICSACKEPDKYLEKLMEEAKARNKK